MPRNMESQPNPEPEKNNEYWYNLALDKVLSFIPEIDEGLLVNIEDRKIRPNKWESYTSLVLHFHHEKDLSIDWTMEIEQSEDYIENRLEDAVRRVYERQK